MRCPQCDAENPDDAVFCAECGSRIVVRQAAHLRVEETEETVIASSPLPGCDLSGPAVSPGRPAASQGTLEQRVPVMLDPSPSRYDDVVSRDHDRAYDADRRPTSLYVGLTMLIAALVAGLLWVTYDAEIWGGRTLPDVVGMTRAEAEAALAEFSVTITEEARDDAIGRVVSMSPSANRRVEPGSEVRLRVGVARVIPEVIGLDQASARQALLDAGARDITIAYVTSSEAEDTVIACEPAPGTPFVSTDKVTLTLAKPLTVPNVVGKTADEASTALWAVGLPSVVEYVESDREPLTVVATVPAAGTRIEEGATITLQVSTPDPTDQRHLVEYFGMTPQQVADYLVRSGYTLDMGWSSDGEACAHYTNVTTGDVLYFTHDPEIGQYDASFGRRDVLAEGVGFVGVRYEYPPGTSEQISTDGVHAVMDQCGFENLVDFCTEETIVAPANAPVARSNFICAYGEQGRYVWAVLIGGYGTANDTVALVLPKAQLEQMDLSVFGGGICDYLAYANYFTWMGDTMDYEPEQPEETPAQGADQEFVRPENEDDDGYDPYSDYRPMIEPLFERDPWA